MVISVACDLLKNVLKIYDSSTIDVITLNFKEVYDKDSITNFFQFLRNNFNHAIDYFFVQVSLKAGYGLFTKVSQRIHHNNEFRENFIEIAQQSNIRNVKIVSELELLIFNALETPPENGEKLWILECLKDCVWGTSFKYEEPSGWKCVARRGKSIQGGRPTFNDLLILKSILEERNTLSLIFVFSEYEIDKNLFKTIFSNYKKITFRANCDSTNLISNYAKHFSENDTTTLYKNNSFLMKRIIVYLFQGGIKLIFIASVGQTLPFKDEKVVNALPYSVITAYSINVYEDGMSSKVIPITGGCNYLIKLEIDTNGIYTVNVTKAFNYEMPQDIDKILIPQKMSNYEPEINAVGIDLGTTECCAAVIRRNGPDFVVLDSLTSSRTMPSFVSFNEAHDKCGQITVNQMRNYAQYTVYDIKRIIGKQFDDIIIDPIWPFNVIQDNDKVKIEVDTSSGRMLKSPEEICAVLIKHIKKCLDEFQSKTLKNAVITIPSEFIEAQIKATAAAAELAGWENIYFLPESIAAAFAYFSEINIPDNSIMAICDCGGGTVDICIAKVSKNEIRILSHHGDPYLGGRDFDRLLFNYFEQKLREDHDYNVMNSNKRYVLKRKCQEIKHTLSAANECSLDVEDFVIDSGKIINITKEEFEVMAADLMNRLRNVILETVTNANCGINKINYVFQVGGGCHMPMIKNLLLNIFPNASHRCNINPDWVVARGAALYAYHLKTTAKQISTWQTKLAKTIRFFNHGPGHPSISHVVIGSRILFGKKR